MKILALDTATPTGSVALLDGHKLVAEILLNVKAVHSERLLDQVQQVLEAGSLTLEDLDLIAVVRGPGSFTGLRIGLATAKGLAQAAKLPLMGISSLQLLAMNLPLCQLPICTFLDARKNEVYTALYQWVDGIPVSIGPELVLPPERALNRLQGNLALVGDAVQLYSSLVTEILGERVHLPASIHHQPRASSAAALASRLFRPELPLDAALLTPVYIRPSDAELKPARKN